MSSGGLSIRINLTERRLYLYQGAQLYNSFLIAIGKPSHPSPLGHWTIVNKAVLDGKQVYGTRWMGLSKDRYGIHGNNNPSSIGKAVSLGCIRMYNHDIESIFPLIPIGTPVKIVSGAQGSGYPLPPYNPPPASNPTPGSFPHPEGAKTYTIKQGDTLWTIAKLHGVALEDIIRLNPHINADQIYPGQVIYLP